MANDVNANINIDINSGAAVAGLRKLQAEIGQFNKSVIASNAAANATQKALNTQLIQQVSSIKGFSSSIVNVQSDLARLGTSIEKNKLSLGEYFKYGVASSKNFGRVFAKEHNEILSLAEDRVKRLQTQYVALGQSQNGVTRALASRPMHLFNADMAISTQRQQLFNKLLRDGSTGLVNWGKNTQWAGRQLMVGFTVPVTLFGSIASKVFMDLEKQVVNFKRVYGDLGTTIEDTDKMVAQIQTLGKEYTKYGISVSDTIALAAKAAAAGAQGNNLIAATEQATRLATLGQVEQNQALTATIALQSAFNISSTKLASTIDFLNAVENQTVVSLDDITIAIPKVAPVIRGLGGDVEDLAVFLAAMREGGVNAAEGANALKSGLASMVNPTKAASESLKSAGINMSGLIKNNKGDLMGLVQDFGAELDNLDKFSRQQVLAKVFGKYQFARLGALFENINKDGSQAQRVIDLTGASIEDLAKLSEKELGNIEQSIGVKFLGAVERLKLSIAPIGKKFLEIVTPVINGVTKIIEKFNEIPDSLKTFIVIGTGIAAVVVPSIIMLIGLLGNFLGNMLKIGTAFRSFIARIRGGGDAFNYYQQEELDAMAASASLDGKVNKLTADINLQRAAVNKLSAAYANMAAAARIAAGNLPQGFRRPAAPRRMATGGFVAGSGNKDTEPALLTPGEFVVNKKAAQENGPILSAMNSGSISKYGNGSRESRQSGAASRDKKSDVTVLRSLAANVGAGGSGTGILADIMGIESTNIADVVALYTKDIAKEAGTSVSAINKEIKAWQVKNKEALDEFQIKLAAAIESGTMEEQQRLIQEVQDNYIADMKKANGPVAKFAAKAEEVYPKYAADLEKTQAIIKQTNVDLSNAEEAAALYAKEQTNLLKRMGQKGSYQPAARASAAALPFLGYDVQSTGLPAQFIDPKIRGTGGRESNVPGLTKEGSKSIALMGTTAEHTNKTLVQLQAEKMTVSAETAVQAKQQSSSPSKVSQELGDEFGEGYARGIESNSGRVKGASAGLAQDASLGLRAPSQSSLALGERLAKMPAAEQGPVSIITRKPSELMPGGGSPNPPQGPGAPAAPRGFSEEEANNQTKRAGKVGKSFSNLGVKIGGVSLAATMAAGAFSSMGGPVGEFANKIFPLLGFLDLLTIPLMFMGGGGGAAAAGGVGAIGAAAAAATPPVTGLAAAEAAVAAPLIPLVAVIGLVVAAIAALAVAFKVTYDRFEPLREAVSSLIETLKVLASEVFGEIIAAFKQMFGITDKAGASFGGFGDILQKVADFLGPIFTVVVKVLTVYFQHLANQVKVAIKIFQIVFNVVKMIANIFKGLFVKAIQFVLDKLGPLGETIKGIGLIFAAVFTNLPEIAKNVFSTVGKWIEIAVNSVVDGINFLIEKYNSLPEWMRGDKIDVVAKITLKYETIGAPPANAPTLAPAEGRDSKIEQGEATPPGGDELDDPPGGGEKEKTFLENLIAEMAANEKLYLTAQGVGKKYILAKGNFFGVFQELRGMGVSEAIINALGVGEEGVKAATELLNKGQKKIKEIVDRFAQANVLGPAVEAARKKIAEASNKRKAEGIINISSSISFTDEEKKTLLGDQNVVDAINAASIKGKGALAEYLTLLKQITVETKEPVNLFQQDIDDLNFAQRLQTKSSQDQIKIYQDKIDGINEEIAAVQKLNDLDQGRIRTLDRQKEMLGRQIEELEKLNSINQKEIESLQRQDSLRQRVSDQLSRDLDQMSKVENDIKSSYDSRVAALDEVAKINDHIISQQRDQLSISQALSSGDIYAATAAAASARQNQIKESQENMRGAMQRGMENQIAGLTTSEGLTRKQVEEQISNIKEQSYQVSLQVRDIEDVIYERNLQIVPLKDRQLQIDTQIRDINDQIYIREDQIKLIQDQQLEPLNKSLKVQQDILKVNDDMFKQKIDDLSLRKDLADLTQDEADRVFELAKQWKSVGEIIAEINRISKSKDTALRSNPPQRGNFNTLKQYENAVEKYGQKLLDIEVSRKADISAVKLPMNAGGMVAKKYYSGGMARKKYYGGSLVSGAGGRDSIPAMLTPGEFVMRKSAVDKYGSPMLSKMNMGAFKMPNYSVGQKEGIDVNSKTTNKTSINAPMYNNYSVSVSVSGTNASADEIANKAVMKIKQMQNTAVRSSRG